MMTAWGLVYCHAAVQAAEQPVWQYIDPEGQVQGPFTAKEMQSWMEGNYLQKDLPVCGMVSCDL